MSERDLGRTEFMEILGRIGRAATRTSENRRAMRREIDRFRHSSSGRPLSKRLSDIVSKAGQAGLSMRHSDSVRYSFFEAIDLMAHRKPAAEQAAAMQKVWLLYEDAGQPGQIL